ncbi:MAG TPA: Coq4 family protein [Caulobacteraceae bacterium]
MVDSASRQPTLSRRWTRRKSPRHWDHAFAALKKLIANGEDTTQVFEIIRALSGRSHEDNYVHLLAQPDGGRLAYEHLEFVEKLTDRTWVESFQPGTVGAAYAEFTSREHLSADGLLQVSLQASGDGDYQSPHPYDWYGRRLRDIHDIWHVVTGYGRDGLGEACMVAFAYAQTHGLGWAFISLGVALKSGDRRARRSIWEGYRRGCAAAWLPGEDYERLLGEPLEEARTRLNLGSSPIYDSVPMEIRRHPTVSHPSAHAYHGLAAA